jgi:hypothetical protein
MKDKPVLTPLQELFSSRKFLLALSIIITEFLIRAVPDLRPYVPDLSGIIFIALGFPILHLSVEDLIKLRQSAPDSQQEASTDLVAEIARVVTALLAKPAEQTVVVNTGASEPGTGNVNTSSATLRYPDGTSYTLTEGQPPTDQPVQS